MGVWLLASFFANVIGGYFSYVESMGAGNIFLYVSIFVIICGLGLCITK